MMEKALDLSTITFQIKKGYDLQSLTPAFYGFFEPITKAFEEPTSILKSEWEFENADFQDFPPEIRNNKTVLPVRSSGTR